jgi:alpha-acetolactate decarboxylase
MHDVRRTAACHTQPESTDSSLGGVVVGVWAGGGVVSGVFAGGELVVEAA